MPTKSHGKSRRTFWVTGMANVCCTQHYYIAQQEKILQRQNRIVGLTDIFYISITVEDKFTTQEILYRSCVRMRFVIFVYGIPQPSMWHRRSKSNLVNLCSTVVEIQYACFGSYINFSNLPKNLSVKNCANYQSNYVESELEHFKNTKYFYCELVTLIVRIYGFCFDCQEALTKQFFLSYVGIQILNIHLFLCMHIV